jgi:O-antigen ligase
VYVLSATVLGVVWQYDDLGLQKNPVGQFIANAALIVVGVPALRRLLPCLLVLTPTLLLTESRGAIVAAALGLATLILLQSSRSHALITRGVPVVAIAVAAFALVPSSVQERVTTLSSAGNSPAAYSISLREQQADDARELIAEHPWTGVGIGNYLTGDSSLGTQTDDPHQVLLLQAAEGGYVLAASFVVLIAGTLLVLGRVRRIETAPAAAAVLVATVAHGLVDVFWVRGTPVLTWLLIGMTLGLLARAPSTGRA